MLQRDDNSKIVTSKFPLAPAMIVILDLSRLATVKPTITAPRLNRSDQIG